MIFISPQIAAEKIEDDNNARYKFRTLTKEEVLNLPISRQHYTKVTQPIVMRYKSTPHVVLSLKSDKSNTQQLLPLVNSDNHAVNWMSDDSSKYYLFWDDVDSENKIIYYDENNNYIKNKDVKYSGLWLGELY
jgi:hypothetical protein